MNPTLIVAFARQRLMSPFRMAFLFVLLAVPMTITLFAPSAGMTVAGKITGIGLVFAVGLIGQDLSSGVLQLLFARPVRRSEYVLSRWLAAGGMTALVGAGQAALVILIMSARGASPGVPAALTFIGERLFDGFGLAAVFVLLSSLVSGVGDVAVWVGIQFVCTIGGVIAQAKGWDAVVRGLTELGAAMNPAIPFAQILHGLAPWSPVSAYLSTITLCLALAVWVMNRRELSYASSNG